MQTQPLSLRAFAFAVSVALLAFSDWANADPPSRVARLGYMAGSISFSPAGENDWSQARINRPLTTGDRLWTNTRSRAEIQIGGAVVRMHGETSLSILNLNDRIAQLQLTQGTLNVRVRRLDRSQVFEIATPNLAFTLRQPGEYRIEVDPDGNATEIIVRRGQGEVYGEGASYLIDSQQSYRFTGTDLRDVEYISSQRPDEFDRWSNDRDRRIDNSTSARYVSQDVVGYEDLDTNGNWRVDATYGNVWYPNRVASGWAPYRDGHWAWVDPWGWTWVDDAPWGFAVSHYGRWTNLRGTWGWVPGPVRTRAYYAPALVAFVGGNNFQLSISSGNVGGVAWFPLAPREVYRPAYTVSRGYFENINNSNTVINNTVINNYYNNTNVTNIVYANRQVPGAVIAVPTTTFVQSQQVSRAAVRVSQEMIVSAPVAGVPRVAPTERSVHGGAAQGDRPQGRMFERAVVARTAPPAAVIGFAAQQQMLTAAPGRPLDDSARRDLRPRAAAAAPAPVVTVVAPAQVAPPTALPPRVAPSSAGRGGDRRGNSDDRATPVAPAALPAPGAPPEQRGRSEQRGNREQRGQQVAPQPAPPQVNAPAPVAPPQVAPPAPSTQPPEQRGKPEQRGNRDQRGQQVAPQPAPPQVNAPPPVAPPQVAPPAPTAQPPEQRGRSEQRGNREQRGQQVAPQPAPPQVNAPAPIAPPQVAPPAPTAQPPEQRGRPEQRGNRDQRGQPAASPPQPQSVPRADPRDQEPKPAAAKPKEKKKDSDEQKRDEENRKEK